MTTEAQNVTNKSKWGYHACSYETFQKLKKLNAYYMQAQHAAAAWWRWARKLSKNRKGNPPALNPVFIKLVKVESQGWGEKRSPHSTLVRGSKSGAYFYNMPGKYETVKGQYGSYSKKNGYNNDDTVLVDPRMVQQSYALARSPFAEANQVPSLGLSVEEIDKMLAECNAWEVSRK